jgi:iron complex outermembrane receptor protein
VETPEWMFTGRAQWRVTEDFTVGFQGKHVGDRYTTDVNDEQSPGYNVFDIDLRYDLPFGAEGTSLQLNVTNIFDESTTPTSARARTRRPSRGSTRNCRPDGDLA